WCGRTARRSWTRSGEAVEAVNGRHHAAIFIRPPRRLQGSATGFPYGRPMERIDTLVIGAGQAGLAVSRCLTDASVDHVLLERGLTQLTGSSYRNPDQVPDGGVLIVGASASGVQLADELARADREVVLAVGNHVQMPRRYRGVDIWSWLEGIGTFAATFDEA